MKHLKTIITALKSKFTLATVKNGYIRAGDNECQFYSPTNLSNGEYFTDTGMLCTLNNDKHLTPLQYSTDDHDSNNTAITLELETIKAVINYTSKNDSRTFLNAICLYLKDNELIGMAATDAHQLIALGQYENEDCTLIIPRYLLDIAIKLKSPIKINSYSDDHALGVIADLNYICTRISAKYPDITRVIPLTNTVKIEVNKTLIPAYKRATKNQDNLLHFNNGIISQITTTAEQIITSQLMRYDAHEITNVYINNEYCNNAFSVIKGDQVVFNTFDNQRSILINSDYTHKINGFDYKIVIMPLRCGNGDYFDNSPKQRVIINTLAPEIEAAAIVEVEYAPVEVINDIQPVIEPVPVVALEDAPLEVVEDLSIQDEDNIPYYLKHFNNTFLTQEQRAKLLALKQLEPDSYSNPIHTTAQLKAIAYGIGEIIGLTKNDIRIRLTKRDMEISRLTPHFKHEKMEVIQGAMRYLIGFEDHSDLQSDYYHTTSKINALDCIDVSYSDYNAPKLKEYKNYVENTILMNCHNLTAVTTFYLCYVSYNCKHEHNINSRHFLTISQLYHSLYGINLALCEFEYRENTNELWIIQKTADPIPAVISEIPAPAEIITSTNSDLNSLEGVIVEVKGGWTWCSGETYPHREIFKAKGFKWSKKRQAWYLIAKNDDNTDTIEPLAHVVTECHSDGYTTNENLEDNQTMNNQDFIAPSVDLAIIEPTTSATKHDEITAIVNKYSDLLENYNQVAAAINNYNDFIKNYNKNEKRIFNEKNPEGYYSEGYYDIRLGRYYDDNSPDLRIKSDFIKAVLNVDKLRKLLTQDKIDQLYLDINKFAQSKDFTISEAAAHDILASFFDKSDDIIKDSLMQLYRKLTHNWNDFKTMKWEAVGEKVILNMRGYSSYQIKNKLNDIERCLNIITGNKEISEWKNDKIDKSPYFDIKEYQNGNVHLRFTDLVALEKLNAKVGSYFNWIRK